MNDKNTALTVALSTMNKHGVRAQLGQAGTGRPDTYALFYYKDGAMRVMYVKKSETDFEKIAEEVSVLLNRSHEEQVAQGNNDEAFKPIPKPEVKQSSLLQLKAKYEGSR